MAAPLILRIIGDASAYLKTSDSVVAANTRIGDSAGAAGVEMEKAATAQVAALVKSQRALEENLVALKAYNAQTAAGSKEQAASALLVSRAQDRYNRSLGITTTTTARAGGEAQKAERDLGKLTRGALAGSGVFTGLGRSLAFASGEFLIFASAGTLLSRSISQAEELQKAHQSLGTALEHTHEDVAALLPQIDKWAAKQAQLGVSTTEAETGLSRMIELTGSSKTAMLAYTAALDISKATGKDFNSVSLAVGKAFAGQTQALARYIGAIPKGIKNQQLYNMILAKYGGQAEANTVASDKLSASLANLETTIGQALLPTFDKYVEKLNAWISNSQNQERVIHDLNALAHDGAEVFHVLGVVVGGVDKVTGSFAHTIEILAGIQIGRWTLSLISALDGLIVKWGLVTTAAEGATAAQTTALGVGEAGAAGAGAAGEGAAVAAGGAGVLTEAIAAAAPIVIPAVLSAMLIDHFISKPSGVNYSFPAGTQGLGSSAISGHVRTIGSGNDTGLIGQNNLGQFTITYVDAGPKSRPGGGRTGTFVVTDAQLARLLPPIVTDAAQAGITAALQNGARTGGIPSPFTPAGRLGSIFRPPATSAATGPFGGAQPITQWTAFALTLAESVGQIQAGVTKTLSDDVKWAKEISGRIMKLIDEGHLGPGTPAQTQAYLNALQQWASAQGVIQSAEAQAAQKRAAAAARALQIASTYTTPVDLQIAQVEAEFTKSTKDDAAALKQIIADAKRAIASGNKNKQGRLAALQVELQAVQALQGLQGGSSTTYALPAKLQLALAKAQATGQPIIPVLLKMKAALERALKAAKGNIEKQTDIYNQIYGINQQLNQGVTDAYGDFKQANLKALTSGLGLTPDQRRALQQRYARVGPGGTLPSGGTTAGGYIIDPATGRPIHLHRPGHVGSTYTGPGGGRPTPNVTTVDLNVYIDGKHVEAVVTPRQQRTRRRNPSSRRGPNTATAAA